MDRCTTPSLIDFLVEYYTYTVATSMMSVDARYSAQSLCALDMERRAYKLVSSSYVGHLCGCWLELLLLIPRIFEFGRTALNGDDRIATDALGPDHVVRFSELHHQILSFVPSGPVHPETLEAGYVFQSAVLLYLLTVLEFTGTDMHGNYGHAVSTAVAKAMSHLARIDPTSRVNTSLCWPLVIIGSSTDSSDIQSDIRDRLQTMLMVIGLGNIRETLVLLEHIWTIPLEQRSPWTLCCTMQEYGLWISFA
jgi:hypothetical protein